jgi:sugar lactone lactonase YvrE
MKSRWISLIVFLSFAALFSSFTIKPSPDLARSSAWGDDNDKPQFPKNATFTTLITTPRGIEGLTGDNHRNLYVAGSGAPPCPVWQINLNSPKLTEVGSIVPASGNCALTGIAFDEAGNLYVADLVAGTIYFFNPSAKNKPIAAIFASGVPGTNGLAFDRHGNLWTGDGTTGQGRVWKITSPGANCTPQTPVNCEEVFRIQPMNNSAAFGGVVPDPGVGRANTTIPPGTAQNLVANGIAFNRDGDMFVIDTARGALWKVEFRRNGNLKSPTGCDTTFTPNTLCLSNVVVAHPILEGGDGIAFDRDGNIWVDANERNAVALVTKEGKVFEVFRNPVNSAGLRNSADPAVGNNHILELPSSPFLTGKLFCTSQSDGNRRDNSPNTAGEISPAGPNIGKISCMDQELKIPGLRLPID